MNTQINFAGIQMKNPVTVASGTFGYGREMSEYIDLNKLRCDYHKRNFFEASQAEINHLVSVKRQVE